MSGDRTASRPATKLINRSEGPDDVVLPFGEHGFPARHCSEATFGYHKCDDCDARYVYVGLMVQLDGVKAAAYISLSAMQARDMAADLLRLADKLDGGVTRQ